VKIRTAVVLAGALGRAGEHRARSDLKIEAVNASVLPKRLTH